MSLYTDGKDFTENWFDGYADLWLEKFGWMRDRPIRALEVGSFEGRSACWMMENLLTFPGSSLVCIDSWDDEDKTLPGKTVGAGLRFLQNVKGYGSKITYMKGKSAQRLADFVSARSLPFDLIFIDGDHEAVSALTDLVLCWQLLAPGGVLIFDDYRWEHSALRANPGKAWDGFMQCNPKVQMHGDLGRAVYLVKE